MTKYTFEEICKTIKTDDGLKLKDRLHFHCFNKNGAVNAKYLADKRINEAVDAGICKSGAIMAYGSLSNYAADKLMKMTRNKRVNRSDLNVLIGMAWYAAKKANEFVDAKIEEMEAENIDIQVSELYNLYMETIKLLKEANEMPDSDKQKADYMMVRTRQKANIVKEFKKLVAA
jgi:hypothetical protein